MYYFGTLYRKVAEIFKYCLIFLLGGVCTLIYKGVNITSSSGIGIVNNYSDVRMFSGSKVECSSTSQYCVKNIGNTYTSTTCANLGNSSSTLCYYGSFWIRQGYIKSVYAAIYSSVYHNSGVYIGSTGDTLYDYTSYSSGDGGTPNPNSGPMVRASDTTYGRGVYMDTIDSKWSLANGLVGGGRTYANEVPAVERSGCSYGDVSGTTYKYVQLKNCS